MRGRVICALALFIAASCVESNPQPFPGRVTLDAAYDFGRTTEEDGGHQITPDLAAPDIVLQFDTTDLMSSDVGGPEIIPDCPVGVGCFLDPCVDNADCQSGWCVQHMGEGICTQHCQEECPTGWSCQQVAGTDPDVVYLCVSQYTNLCRPCATSADCIGPGGAEDACVTYPGEGSFCGGPCGDEGICPEGFTCQSVPTSEGSELAQCVLTQAFANAVKTP